MSLANLAGVVSEEVALAVPHPDGQPRFPAFQPVDDAPLPGLPAVLSALPGRDPWFRLNWIFAPESRLTAWRPPRRYGPGTWRQSSPRLPR